MKEIKISNLFTYPIKSTKGIALESSVVEKIGLKYDRNFAILNQNNKVITARENPRLLNISSEIKGSKLTFNRTRLPALELDLEAPIHKEKVKATIFKDETSGEILKGTLNEWITEVLEEPAQLMMLDKESLRKVKEKYNGVAGDQIAYSDASPIHLISEESLQSLNEKLERPVTINHFRPNIVVKGCEAFEEENWKTIKIGDCIFDVAIGTERCVFINIDPDTAIRDKNQEPLRTLSKFNRKDNKVTFGMYLTPRKLGTITLNDKLIIE